ncbi:MAG: hypothetical protein H6718_09335 [Polyangiaceae bacterium]|nr:hypothetical protein [Myxococcales bacterium]MCB9585589.1 hypothetical protein [Polyangiaceae bacterium]MCB9606396.1 hypothetical protein [Polyangiaceae bacterium]
MLSSTQKASWFRDFWGERGAAARVLLLTAAGLTSACGGPGQAEDPRDILGEDLYYDGQDGTQGTKPGAPDPLDREANEAECRKAFTHIQRIGAENAARAEKDPVKAKQIRDAANSANAKAAVERDVKRCLAEGVSAREALCYSKLRASSSEEDLERQFERCADYQ